MAGCDLREDQRHRVEIPEDEDIPAAFPGATLGLLGHFPLPVTTLVPRLAEQSAKRPGDLLDTGPNKEQRTEKDSDESDLDMDAMDVTAPGTGKRPASRIEPNPVLDLALYRLTAMDTDDRRLDVSGADRRNAIDFPNERWAPFARLYNLDVLPHPSQNAAFRTDPFMRMGP